jgi:hypothetical protein
LTRLPLLKALQPELANLAKGLTPDGSGTLTTADNGASVVLTADVNTSLQAQLQAVGLSLPTQQRYFVTSETLSPSGAVTSPYNAFHIASAAEMTDIGNGVKGTTPAPFGGTITTSTVTTVNGSQTIYAYNASAQYTVASLADLQSLSTADASSVISTSSEISDEMKNLSQASERLVQLAKVSDAQFMALHDQHAKATGEQQEQVRQNVYEVLRLNNEDASQLQQNGSPKKGS